MTILDTVGAAMNLEGAAMDFRRSVLEFIDDCQMGANDVDLLERLSNLGARLGFEKLAIVNFWQVGDTVLPGIRSVTFDQEFVERYARHRVNLYDPLWQSAERAQSAFYWRNVWRQHPHDRGERVRDLYREAGMIDGFTVPVLGEFSRKSIVTFASNQPVELAAGDETLLVLATIVFRRSPHARYLDRSQTANCRDRLTAREREILTWTAAGKSAWEISTILKLSEATVARHLLNVRAKLKAANTVQAVAQAIRLNEITL